jgi:23S rRNA (pseudouridine1915-N3)-methyltransferase
MKITLLQTGKTTDKNVSEVADLYINRIKKYAPFEVLTLPDIKNTKKMPVQEQKIKEGEKMLQVLSDEDLVVLLDENGKELRTLEFADALEKMFFMPKKRIVFVIGGPYGFSDSLYARADKKMSLSKMTFPHQLVRLLFLEQLYRSFTIIKNEPYHHE